MSSSSKVKMLLVGSVGDQLPVLSKKLQSLNSSKAGPFDLCFCVGSTVRLEEQIASLLDDDAIPFPLYLQQIDDGNNNSSSSESAERRHLLLSASANKTSSTDTEQGIISLGKNIYYLRGKDGEGVTDNKLHMFQIYVSNHKHPLLVATCPRHIRAENPNQQLQEQCDLLLSIDWPQGMEDVLHVDTEPLSYDVAQIAMECRPRYHICPSSRFYHASPPYGLPNSDHVGRFIALAPVSAEKKPAKNAKFIHALGLEPLAGNPPSTTAPSILPCPFLLEAPRPSGTTASSTTTTTTAKTGSLVPKFAMQGMNGDPKTAYSFFAVKNNNNNNPKRGRSKEDDRHDDTSLVPPDDPTISTLFLYGLHKDVTGELQSTSSPKVLLAFGKYGVTKVRHPPNTPTSTYCFLEFPSQRDAFECLLDCQGRITIDNVDLTIKWATATPRQQQQQQQQQQHPNKRPKREDIPQQFVPQAEAMDSMTLFFHPPKKSGSNSGMLSKTGTTSSTGTSKSTGTTNEGTDKNGEKEIEPTTTTDAITPPGVVEEGFSELLRLYLEKALEDALNDGVGDDEDRVTAETEPALKVTVRTKDNYGFLEFASHAAATMALAALTKSTDGGAILPDPDSGPSPSPSLVGTTLRWAKGPPPSTVLANKKKGSGDQRDDILQALGLKRQYYPSDNRTDCWFCLSSPTCETHLIVGVYDEWYAAMPKGPVHPGHVLLVPVAHTSEGAWTLSTEWVDLVGKLQQHASMTYDMDLFIFERSMETRGGYHTHIQCVPIPRDATIRLQSAMIAHAKASGFDLRPIQSDLGVKALIEKNDSYFYAEIRSTSQQYRFLYRHEAGGGGGGKSSNVVPLQFAREVLASVLNNPKLAHWKACVVDKEQETELTSTFRTSFSAVLR